MRATTKGVQRDCTYYVELSIIGNPDLWSGGPLSCCGSAATSAVGCSLLRNPLGVSFCYCSCDYV